MNEMYNMSIVAHYYSVIGILVVILVNIWMLNRATDISVYRREMRIFTPIGSTMIGSIIFTGVIMMAAKHLSFSVENILMILFALLIILLEVKRAKTLKYMNSKTDNALENFKTLAIKILAIEVLLTMAISLWMWM